MRLGDLDELKERYIVLLKSAMAIGTVVSPDFIDNAPTVEYPFYQEAYQSGYEEGKNDRQQGDIFSMKIVAGKCPIEAGGDCPLRPQGEWIPIKLRPGTDEEYEEFCKYGDCPREDFRVFECPLPDDDQEVLVTTRWGDVCVDIWHRDVDCCYFENNCDDDDDVIAWMPLPEPYKKEGEK